MFNNNKDSSTESVIEFYSLFPKMTNVFPEPEVAKANIPQWFKDTKPYIDNNSTPSNGMLSTTVKRCPAILDSFMTGYYLLAPADIYIDTTDGKRDIQVAGNHSFFSRPMTGVHSYMQYNEMPIDEEIYHIDLFRLNVTWLVKTAPGYSCLFLNPMNYGDSPLKAIEGIIDTDEFLTDGLFSFLVKKNFKGYVKRGTPIIQVIPFKRVDFSHEIIVDNNITDTLFEQSLKLRSVFGSGYKKFFHSEKRFL